MTWFAQFLSGRRLRQRSSRPSDERTPPVYTGQISVLWAVNGHGQHLVAELTNGKFGPLASIRVRKGESPYSLAAQAAKRVLGYAEHSYLALEVGPEFGITLYRRRYEVVVYLLRVSDHGPVSSLDTVEAATRLGHIKAWWSEEATLLADLGLNAGRYLVGVHQCLMELSARRAWRRPTSRS